MSRETDARVHAEIFGRQLLTQEEMEIEAARVWAVQPACRFFSMGFEAAVPPDSPPKLEQSFRRYSTSIADAWLVVEKMRKHPDAHCRTLRMVSYPYNRTYATFDLDLDSEDWVEANGEHADAEAICGAALRVAALKAVEE